MRAKFRRNSAREKTLSGFWNIHPKLGHGREGAIFQIIKNQLFVNWYANCFHTIVHET
jgi:hypothetical protein